MNHIDLDVILEAEFVFVDGDDVLHEWRCDCLTCMAREWVAREEERNRR